MKHRYTLLLILILTVFIFAFTGERKERRFFIGYTGTTSSGATYSGGEEFGVDDFPNLKAISEHIKKSHNLERVYVVSLYEFQSESDSFKFWK